MKVNIEINTNDNDRTTNITLETRDTAKTGPDSSCVYFSDAFEWINGILYCLPMWVTTTSDNKSRNIILNYFGSIISIGFVFVYCVCQYYLQITGWWIYSDIDNSIWCGYVAFICSSRLLSIIYCNKYFNWSWKCDQYEAFTLKMKKDIIRCKILYISFAICYVVADIIVLYLQTDALGDYYHNSMMTYILVKSMSRLFLLYPQLISTIIQSIITLKYYLYLNELYNKLLITSDTDLKDIFKHYDNTYKSFKKDHHWSLGISVKLFLAAEILFFWDSFNFIGLWCMLLIAIRILPVFMLYFYPACILENIYTLTENQLWKNGQIYLNNKENKHDMAWYNYILHFIKKYPIYLKFGSIIISEIKVIKFCVMLLMTKSLWHFTRVWIEENY